MNSILLEALDTFKVSYGNIIRSIFVKTNITLSVLITYPITTRHVLPLTKSLLYPRMKTSRQ